MKKNSCNNLPSVALLEQQTADMFIRHKLAASGDTLIVAVSGGPDSTALLHILHSCPFPLSLIAVYINHCLRPAEAEKEQAAVREFAHSLNILFENIKVDVPERCRQTGESLEQAARFLRYQALEQLRITHQAQAIAVGHTADDQSEEILIRLIRGGGRKSLSGMAYKNNYIIRPLLKIKKITLINYLKEKKTGYCLDSSNKDPAILRNRVRMLLLPLLENDFNPGIRKTLRRTAEILQEEEHLLETLTNEALKNTVVQDNNKDPENKLVLQPFARQHPAIQRRILEKLCWQSESTPSFKQIELLRQLALNGKTGSEIHLQQGVRARKTISSVHIEQYTKLPDSRGPANRTGIIDISIPEPGCIHISELNHCLTLRLTNSRPEKDSHNLLIIDNDTITWPLHLKSLQPGDKFMPLGAPGNKKISRFLVDQKIPKAERHLYPLLVSGDMIIAVTGLRIAHGIRETADTSSWLLVSWIPNFSKNSSN